MDKSKVQMALELVKSKLATGATFFGHDVEQVEAALEEAFAAEKAKKAPKEKK